MADRVACLRCGHTFLARNDLRSKKTACPQCGATDQVELVGVAPPPDSPPDSPPQAESPGAASSANESEAAAEPGQAAQKVAPPPETRDPVRAAEASAEQADSTPGGGGLRRAARPILATIALAAVLAGGVYVAWTRLRPSVPAASSVREEPKPQQPAHREPPPPPAQAIEAQRPEPEPVARVDTPWAEAEPHGEAAPRQAAAGPGAEVEPHQEEPQPGGEVAAAPAAPEKSAPEPVAPEKLTPESPAEAATEAAAPRPAPPPPVVAGSLDEAEEALVKFELPLGIGDLVQYGAGFVVDSRGWVATNNHVASNITTAARVKMADGTRLEIEGTLASWPSRDLAVVKLANPPKPLTILDIQYEGSPALGTHVYAFGHPYQAEFSLSEGIVGRVLTSGELLDASPRHLVGKLGAPADMVWIQHDAKISPGNSGGPLIDPQGRVLGINTFVNVRAGFGYASHVRYLRELVAKVTGKIKAPPPPREFVRTVVSSQRIKDLFEASNGFAWRPKTVEQYDQLAELAKQMTLAKHAMMLQGAAPGTAYQPLLGVARFTDRAFAAMLKARWGPEQFTAINAFSVDQVDKVGHGVILYGAVWASAEKQGVLVMAIHGTQKPVLVQVGGSASKFPPGSRWLVLGFVTPRTATVNVKGRSDSYPAHVLLAHYMLPVR